MAQIKQFTFNIFQERTAVAWNDGPACVIVDPGFYSARESLEFFQFIEQNGLEPEEVLITHAHFDHIYGVSEILEHWNIPVYMDPIEELSFEYNKQMVKRVSLDIPKPFPYTPVKEGDKIAAAGFTFETISTPGHAPGALCFLDREKKIMFTGDTLFAGTIGRTDLLHSDYDQEILSIMNKLIILDPDIRFYPGHGLSSTIGRERTNNPFLEPFNEPEEPFDPDAEPVIINGLY